MQLLTSQQTWDHYAKLLQHLLLVGDIVKVWSFPQIHHTIANLWRRPQAFIIYFFCHRILTMSDRLTPDEKLQWQ